MVAPLSEAEQTMVAILCRTLSRLLRNVAMASPSRETFHQRRPRPLKADSKSMRLPSIAEEAERGTPQPAASSALAGKNRNCAAQRLAVAVSRPRIDIQLVL
jgi:hypothetical protein